MTIIRIIINNNNYNNNYKQYRNDHLWFTYFKNKNINRNCLFEVKKFNGNSKFIHF